MKVTTGKITEPQRVVIYGPEGVGKSTLAAAFPNPVFLDIEGGTKHLPLETRLEPENWQDVLTAIADIAIAKYQCGTLVVDTADWLERLLTAWVCEKASKSSIEDFGYGKGYVQVAEEFSAFLGSLNRLRALGINIVMLNHSQIKKFEQPDAAGAYDRYELKLSKHCAPILKEWCDMLLFCNYDTKVVERDGKAKAKGGKDRVMYSSHFAGWDAKNRHGFPEKLPMEYAAIAHAIPTREPVKTLAEILAEHPLTAEQVTKLFAHLGCDAVPGDEKWEDLSPEQTARATSILRKKFNT